MDAIHVLTQYDVIAVKMTLQKLVDDVVNYSNQTRINSVLKL